MNTWYGLGKPGTKVANIACKCSPATSPRIWYQSRNNLMASLLINFQEFPGCNSLDISLPIAWYCHFLPKCSGKKSKTFSSKYKTASSSSLCDLCAPIFGKKKKKKKKKTREKKDFKICKWYRVIDQGKILHSFLLDGQFFPISRNLIKCFFTWNKLFIYIF